jgi:hypothetical protein
MLLIKQTYYLNEHQTLRRHKMKIAFFDSEMNIDIKDVIL